jgi:hypothetical protein
MVEPSAIPTSTVTGVTGPAPARDRTDQLLELLLAKEKLNTELMSELLAMMRLMRTQQQGMGVMVGGVGHMNGSSGEVELTLPTPGKGRC